MNRKERRRQAKQAKADPSGDRNAALSAAKEGEIFTNSGDLPNAVQAFLRALSLDPTYAEGHFNLGVLLRMQGQPEAALESYRRAIALQPNFVEAHYNLGNTHLALGQLDDAIAAYTAALNHRADFAEAANNLGNALKEAGRLEEALVHCQRAIALKPAYAEALSNAGAILRDLGRAEDALEPCRKSIEIAPDYAQAHSNLGLALQDTGQLEQAVAHFERAITLLPDYPEAHSNLGVALQALGRLDEASASYTKALELDPNCVEAHNNFSMLQLLTGDFENGWRNFAWQWQMKGATTKPRNYPQPFWDGSDFTGKTLFVYPVQGFGDFIQFSRYIPLVQARGGDVWVEVPSPLHPLFDTPGATNGLCFSGRRPETFDIQVRLLDLPGIFKTTLETIPSIQPLRVPENLTIKWRDKLSPHTGKRIGLVWAGNPDHKNDHNRSVDPQLLIPLMDIESADFFSLQVGQDGEAARLFGERVVDLGPELTNFAETAAAMMNLDIIITIDSAPAHLAATLGRPTWVLLPYMPDWRWLLNRDDSPWYPSLRLFRQRHLGDWADVTDRLGQNLANL